MGTSIRVRAARLEDAAAMAQVHADSWRETYTGLFPEEVLAAHDATARERFWNAVLGDERYRPTHRSVVAERDGEVVGIAMTARGNPSADDPVRTELCLIYVLAAHHGSGAGPALLDAVLADDPGPVGLWVADPNPRAQAFYRRHGFTPTGQVKTEDGVTELRFMRQ